MDSDSTTTEISPARIWFSEDGLRIAADLVTREGERIFVQPYHVSMFPSGVFRWEKHKIGGTIPAIPLEDIPGFFDLRDHLALETQSELRQIRPAMDAFLASR